MGEEVVTPYTLGTRGHRACVHTGGTMRILKWINGAIGETCTLVGAIVLAVAIAMIYHAMINDWGYEFTIYVPTPAPTAAPISPWDLDRA